jgi:tetratricopeptide (TPR) repeat protein
MEIGPEKLALHLRQRKPQSSLASKVTLFGIGRLSAATGLVILAVLLWGSGSGHFNPLMPGLVAALAVFLLPILLAAVYLGARLGLLGLTEFICGLAFLPMSIIGGAGARQQTFHMLAMICSGQGRFKEALKHYRNDQITHNIFANQHATAWNNRDRLPELLARLGRTEEAWALAKHNVEQAKNSLNDIVSPPTITNLQCTLIVAAQILDQSGQSDQAGPYLEEAYAMSDWAEAPYNAILLALYARGLESMQALRYEEAIQYFKQCGDDILATRKASGSNIAAGSRNSELLGFSQTRLFQCYLKCGQKDKLKDVLELVAKENRSEPVASVDKVSLDFIEADYKMSQGHPGQALAILEKTIITLSKSDAQVDQLLVAALQKYEETLSASGKEPEAKMIGESVEHLIRQKPQQEKNPRALLMPLGLARLPDLSLTRNIANRSVIFFIAIFGYAIINYIFHRGQFDLGVWSLFSAIALLLCARSVWEQVRQRKANFFAQQALATGQALDVVLEPEGQMLPGVAMKNCRIAEGPAQLLGRKLEIDISNNLVYASQAIQTMRDSQSNREVKGIQGTPGTTASPRGHSNPASQPAQNTKIKARLYQCQTSGKVLAIETLGRVLIVKKEHTL